MVRICLSSQNLQPTGKYIRRCISLLLARRGCREDGIRPWYADAVLNRSCLTKPRVAEDRLARDFAGESNAQMWSNGRVLRRYRCLLGSDRWSCGWAGGCTRKVSFQGWGTTGTATIMTGVAGNVWRGGADSDAGQADRVMKASKIAFPCGYPDRSPDRGNGRCTYSGAHWHPACVFKSALGRLTSINITHGRIPDRSSHLADLHRSQHRFAHAQEKNSTNYQRRCR